MSDTPRGIVQQQPPLQPLCNRWVPQQQLPTALLLLVLLLLLLLLLLLRAFFIRRARCQ